MRRILKQFEIRSGRLQKVSNIFYVAHDCVLTNVNRVQRHLVANFDCSACANVQKTTLHLLRDCVAAKEGNGLPLSHLFHTGFGSGAIIVFGVLRKFQRRKKAVILLRKKEFSEAQYRAHKDDELAGKFGGIPKVNWTKPPSTWIKLNMDGAFNSVDQMVGASGVLCNHLGIFLKGFVARRLGRSAFQVEILGLFHGLQMTKELVVPNLLVECDAKRWFQLSQRRSPWCVNGTTSSATVGG
ncbi:LOW QUALITY PROTEIN: hypothetical protein V2J09_011182 [Rumex salicifolius]